MLIKFNTNKNKLIVHLNGELDHHSANEVRKKIDEMLDRNKCNSLIFDFDKVSFMDSSGIGVIIGRYKKIIAYKGKMAMVCPRDTVKKVFELSGLQKIMKCYDSVNDAVNNL